MAPGSIARWLLPGLVAAACSGGAAPPPRRAEAPPAPLVEPEEPVPMLEEDTAPEGASCELQSECEDGTQCRGPAGCEQPWACGEPRRCGDATVSYCGCEGFTFYAPEECPGQPYQHRGPCASLGEEIAADEVDEVAGNAICTSDDDCPAGSSCAGAPGCSTFWTCVRRRSLRCDRSQVALCSCSGETFFGSARCPGRPFAHAGYCTGDEPGEAVAAADPLEAAASAVPPSERPASPANDTRAQEPASVAPPTPTAASGCMSNRDCPRGLACEGAEGCASEWRCVRPQQRCTADTQYFCGCDGRSFRASMSCPGRPHQHRGSCAARD